MVRGVVRELLGPGLGVLRELVELHHRRHQRDPVRDHRVDQVRRTARCRARCSRCRPRSAPAAPPSPKQCAVTLAPCSCATAIASANASGGNDGARSPSSRRDPVADQLDPAVAALRLLGDVRRQLVGLDLVGVVADVALGPGDVPARADQARQVLAVVDPARCRRPSRSRGSAARRRRGRRPPAASVSAVVDRAVVVEPQVAVRVDQPRARSSRSPPSPRPACS